MPSKSYINFLKMRGDVLKLIEIHRYLSNGTRGRKNLGFITRSAIIMLCAAWERYNEDLLLESIDFVCVQVDDISILNKSIKKLLSSKVKIDKNDIKPIELAGFGWKSLWKNYALQEVELLNTPKSFNLNRLFEFYLGISSYSRFWKSSTLEIDAFVKDRGEIAHNGSRAKYITMIQLKKYQELIIQTVINIDSSMSDELVTIAKTSSTSWTKDYSKELSYY